MLCVWCGVAALTAVSSQYRIGSEIDRGVTLADNLEQLCAPYNFFEDDQFKAKKRKKE